MYVYAVDTCRKIYVRPGQNPESDPAEWYEDAAKTKPIQFQVIFDDNGRSTTEVIDSVGKYLIEMGKAKKSGLSIPASLRRRVA